MNDNRRGFLRSAAALAAGSPFFLARGAFADELVRTPSQTEGPFYPPRLPLDTDNDLLIINDDITPAVGEIAHVSGRILDASGNPMRNVVVEIWQCDANGAYLHPGSDNGGKRDGSFQGFGRFTTGTSGEYYFRTIKPVPYPGRSPHIHYKIYENHKPVLTTQCYIKGHPGNERDGVYRGIREEAQRKAVSVDFAPVEGSKIGELAARFDVVLGFTPEG